METSTTVESPLVEHARRELNLIGEEPQTIEWYLSVVRAFAAYRHSGGSASVAIPTLSRLLSFRPLAELTSDPAEWIDRSSIMNEPWWQNLRDSRAMSRNGGKDWWYVE